MLAKLAIVEEEADECLYWLELLIASEIVAEERLQDLMQEADEIVALTVASIKTLRTGSTPKADNPRTTCASKRTKSKSGNPKS